jgi:hypothetical protein
MNDDDPKLNLTSKQMIHECSKAGRMTKVKQKLPAEMNLY